MKRGRRCESLVEPRRGFSKDGNTGDELGLQSRHCIAPARPFLTGVLSDVQLQLQLQLTVLSHAATGLSEKSRFAHFVTPCSARWLLVQAVLDGRPHPPTLVQYSLLVVSSPSATK